MFAFWSQPPPALVYFQIEVNDKVFIYCPYRPKVRRVQRLRSEVHGVAEMPRALQLSNLIACVVRDYLLIIARPFCCSPAVWP